MGMDCLVNRDTMAPVYANLLATSLLPFLLIFLSALIWLTVKLCWTVRTEVIVVKSPLDYVYKKFLRHSRTQELIHEEEVEETKEYTKKIKHRMTWRMALHRFEGTAINLLFLVHPSILKMTL